MFGIPSGKLLGFLVAHKGIEANPEKVKEIEDMSPPQTLREMQKLTGRVIALGRFISKIGERALPFFKLMKKKGPSEWTQEVDQAFQDLKKYLTSPLMMVAPRPLEPQVLYLVATPYSVSVALVAVQEERRDKAASRLATAPAVPAQDQEGLVKTTASADGDQPQQGDAPRAEESAPGSQVLGLSRLRRRLRRAWTSSSIWCISSARCCGMQGQDTPYLRSSCSRYWWPRESCGTTFKATPSRSSQPTHWKGYSGAPTPLGGSPNGTLSCKRFNWSSAQPGSSKRAALADFVAAWTEVPGLEEGEDRSFSPGSEAPNGWVMYFDGAFSRHDAGAGAVLISPTKDKLYYAVQLCFQHGEKVSKNIAEYEGLIAGLKAVAALGVKRLIIKGDSQLLVNFSNKVYELKDEHMEAYLAEVRRMEKQF